MTQGATFLLMAYVTGAMSGAAIYEAIAETSQWSAAFAGWTIVNTVFLLLASLHSTR